MPRAPWILTLVISLATVPIQAQDADREPHVVGTVTDSTNGQPVATARVSLLDGEGERIHTVLTDGEGRFRLEARAGGPHTLEVDRLGYQLQRTDAFEVASEGVTPKDVRLVNRAIELDEIRVRAYPGQLIHEGSMAGVLARRARSPSVGSNRVLVRGDPDLDHAVSIADLLPGRIRPSSTYSGRRGWCGYLYVDGWETNHLGADYKAMILSLPPREVRAIEFYRDLTSVPMSIRPMEERGDFGRLRRCGLLAVWTVGAPR